MTYRVLVCGGRDYADRRSVFDTLDWLNRDYGPLTLIQGGAQGADRLAVEWCNAKRSCRLIKEPPGWETYGEAAERVRNQRLLDQRPDLVVAFPGGVATADMVRRAGQAGVSVLRVGGHRETTG